MGHGLHQMGKCTARIIDWCCGILCAVRELCDLRSQSLLCSRYVPNSRTCAFEVNNNSQTVASYTSRFEHIISICGGHCKMEFMWTTHISFDRCQNLQCLVRNDQGQVIWFLMVFSDCRNCWIWFEFVLTCDFLRWLLLLGPDRWHWMLK